MLRHSHFLHVTFGSLIGCPNSARRFLKLILDFYMIPLIDILSYVNRPLAHWIFLHLAISKFFTSSWCVLHALAYVEARATASSTQLYCSTLYITRPQTQHLVTSLQCIYYCIFYRPLVRLFQPQATQCVHHSAEGTLAETSPVPFLSIRPASVYLRAGAWRLQVGGPLRRAWG